MKVKELINELTKFNLEADVVTFAHFKKEPFTISWEAIVSKSESPTAVIYLDRLNYPDITDATMPIPHLTNNEQVMKKSGIELIAIERQEQIEKHGRTVIKDVAYSSNPTGPFKMLPLIIGVAKMTGAVGGLPWPENWDEAICEKMERKSKKEKLIIAGAFIAAEIDRLQAIENVNQ